MTCSYIQRLYTLGVVALTCALMMSCSDNNADDTSPKTDTGPVLKTFDEACSNFKDCTTTKYASESKVAIWRVEVIRQANGDVSVGALSKVDVPGVSGRPTSASRGSHVLVAYDAQGEAQHFTMVRFPEQLIGLEVDTINHVVADLSGTETRTVVHIEATDVARLSILDDQGSEVSTKNVIDGAGGLDVRQQRLIQPSTSCPHVIVLEGGEDYDWLPSKLQATIVNPGPVQRALLQTALNRMEPLMCHSIGRVVFLKDSKIVGGSTTGAVASYVAGDLIMLNADMYDEQALQADGYLRMRFMSTMFHEATHTVQSILDSNGKRPTQIVGGWQAEATSMAWDTIETMRMRKGISREWYRLHDSFISLGWAQPYTTWPDSKTAQSSVRNKLNAMSEDEIARAGVTSRYGLTKVSDDMADMVAATKVRLMFKEQGLSRKRTTKDGSPKRTPEDSACVALQELGPTLPAKYSAVFTKLHFIRQLGLVSQAEFDECKGPKIDILRDQPGMFFKQGDSGNVNHFARNVTAKIGSNDDGDYKFVITSQGDSTFGDTTSTTDATLTLHVGDQGIALEEASWPRGVYSLAPGQGNDFRVYLPDAEAGSFEVFDGDVLVFESSSKAISGSIVVRRAMRWLAPVPVPQTFDPPLSVRFTITK